MFSFFIISLGVVLGWIKVFGRVRVFVRWVESFVNVRGFLYWGERNKGIRNSFFRFFYDEVFFRSVLFYFFSYSCKRVV